MTMESDLPATGPLSIDDVLNAAFPDQPEQGEATEAQDDQAAPDAVADGEDASAGVEAADDADPDAEDTPEEPDSEASGEPQHLSLEEFGDVTIPVRANGEELRVNLKEAAAGYQRHADYTRKTEALAAERRKLEDQWQDLQEQAAEKSRRLDEQLAKMTEQEPDWERLADEDPLGYPAAQAKWNKRKAEAEAAQRRLSESAELARAKRLHETAAKAVEAMPEWQDGAKFDAGAKARRDAALAAGFTEQEYNGAEDFRLAVILEKAARYDALQAERPAVEKRVAKAPKVIKPGAVKTKAERASEQRAAIQRRLNRPMTTEEAMKLLDEAG